jgi:hypothetical protein
MDGLDIFVGDSVKSAHAFDQRSGDGIAGHQDSSVGEEQAIIGL